MLLSFSRNKFTVEKFKLKMHALFSGKPTSSFILPPSECKKKKQTNKRKKRQSKKVVRLETIQGVENLKHYTYLAHHYYLACLTVCKDTLA